MWHRISPRKHKDTTHDIWNALRKQQSTPEYCATQRQIEIERMRSKCF